MKNSHRQFLITSVLGSLLLLDAPARLLAQPIELSVSPAEQSSPALRYRLLPISSELNPGDAAPIYLRLRHEINDAAWKQIEEKHDAWNSLPLERVPISEARRFVDQWVSTTQLLRIGTRRQFCDWSYPIAEQRLNMIEMLLPDCQSMRQLSRLLRVKARVETAEHSYDQALDTIQTGLVFGRHVSSGPFVINNLTGIAICSVMLERLEELISQPGVPNLYWALTALPQPLVSMREALETEQRLGENLVPELALTDQPHSRGVGGPTREALRPAASPGGDDHEQCAGQRQAESAARS